MDTFFSGSDPVRIERCEPTGRGQHPALLLAHGSGGAVSWWLNRFGPQLAAVGIGVHAPHYFDKTHTGRATAEMILDGQHFAAWLRTLEDAIADLRGRPATDASRIGLLGISLGGYLAIALGINDPNIRAVIEISGGMPPGWEGRVSAEDATDSRRAWRRGFSGSCFRSLQDPAAAHEGRRSLPDGDSGR